MRVTYGRRLKRVRSGDYIYYYLEKYEYKKPIVERRHAGRASLSVILKLGSLQDLFYVSRNFFFAEGIVLPNGDVAPAIQSVKLSEDPLMDLRAKVVMTRVLVKPFKKVRAKFGSSREKLEALRLGLIIVLTAICDQLGDLRARGWLPSLDPEDVMKDLKKPKKLKIKVYKDGRLTLPKIARKVLAVSNGGYIEMTVRHNEVVLTPNPVRILTWGELLALEKAHV